MSKEKKVKPKKYTHIDYIALLTHVMKRRISVESAIDELELNISRSTIVRNIKKIKETGNEEEKEIINLYQEQYVPNMQKDEFPESLQLKIDNLPEKGIINKNELEDLYNKLYRMKQIIESCNGNIAEAARVISSGTTILGNVSITPQGLNKVIKKFEQVKEEYYKQQETDKRRE